MKIKLFGDQVADYQGDGIVFFIRQPGKGKISCGKAAPRTEIEQAFKVGDFLGKEGQSLLVYPTVKKGRGPAVARILVVGLGKDEPDRETLRKAGGTAAREFIKTKARRIMVVLPEDIGLDAAQAAECLTEGVILGAYKFHKYKKFAEPEEAPGALDEVCLAGGAAVEIESGVRAGQVAAEAACVARDMANEPANQWTPTHFADFGRVLAKTHGLKCKILGKEDMQRLGMNGILGINQGSSQPPVLVTLEYRGGGKKAPTLLLVGKGLTFDSGGISLKPSAGMEEMKYDMCGGAAVICAMQAVAREKPKGVNVVALVPSTENLPGPSAIKPGDIVTIYGGKTVEVLNTDAEGRMILADALAYGVEKFKPAAVVDLATLTGAVIIGLGHHRTGLLANNDELAAKVLAAGERCGEPLWRLPLGPEYSKQLKSEIADLKNVDKRDAGTILGAAFLQEFVGEVPWAHLDIAGTAWNYTEKSYVAKGPSAVGVRTLVELVRAYQAV